MFQHFGWLQIAGLVTRILFAVVGAEQRLGAGKGEEKRSRVQDEVMSSLGPEMLTDFEPLGPADELGDAVGDLIDALVRLFNSLGLFGDLGASDSKAAAENSSA